MSTADHKIVVGVDGAEPGRAAVAPGARVDTAMPPGSPTPFLLDVSKSAAMVVVGGSGKGFFAEAAIGSTASAVLAHAWQEKYPDVPVERVLVRDRPRQILLEWSSQALAHHAECPVMVVRPRDAR
jgi:nucleotide-binding universal stress UspA family protein